MQAERPVADKWGFGVLTTGTPLRVLEISRTGCLIEISRPIEPGTIGELRVDIEGRVYSEELRVTRCQPLEGSYANYRLGAEFLPTRRTTALSLRRACSMMIGRRGADAGGRELPFVPSKNS